MEKILLLNLMNKIFDSTEIIKIKKIYFKKYKSKLNLLYMLIKNLRKSFFQISKFCLSTKPIDLNYNHLEKTTI